MRGADVPQSEIERAREFMRGVRKDRTELKDEDAVGPHMLQTTYAQLLRLFAWYALERMQQTTAQANQSATHPATGNGYPQTLADLSKRGYRMSDGKDGTNAGRCRDCGEDVEWWKSPKGKNIPFNPMVRDSDPAVAHWDTCSDKGAK